MSTPVFTTANFFGQQQKRNDQVEGDAEAAIKAANNGDDSNDESADVKDADGINAGNNPTFGPTVSAPKVATGTSASAGVSVQHGPSASMVKP